MVNDFANIGVGNWFLENLNLFAPARVSSMRTPWNWTGCAKKGLPPASKPGISSSAPVRSSAPPPLPALREAGFITSDEALSARALPPSLIVLGGGAVATELAQFFGRFGVKVTLVQRSAHLLSGFDEDAASVLERVFRHEGIDRVCRDEIVGGLSRGK